MYPVYYRSPHGWTNPLYHLTSWFVRLHTQWLSLFTSIAEGKHVFNSFISGSLLTSYGFHIISFLLWSSYNIYIYFPELGIIYSFQARNLSPTFLEQLKTPKLSRKWLHIWLMRRKQIQSGRFGIFNERGSMFEGGSLLRLELEKGYQTEQFTYGNRVVCQKPY